jgi:regulator of sigma E protease
MFHIILAVLGISLVIFVHELGHFLAARLCGVRVETFSIGMGPRVFSWQRGDTRYQIAALPLGGYVKMAGDELVDPDNKEDQREPSPDELAAKGVGARFLIFSGGVIMNVVFGLVVFPIVFLVGVPFTAPIIGSTALGSPAWQAGLQPGTEVLAVNGKDVFAFDHIPTAIALAPPGPITLLVRAPGAGEPTELTVLPETREDLGIRLIGINPALDEDLHLGVTPGSAAAEAGVLDGDMLRGVENSLLGVDLVTALRLAIAESPSVTIQVETPEQPGSLRSVTLSAATTETPHRRTIGVAQIQRRVAAVRRGFGVSELGIQEGDLLLDLNGHAIIRTQDLRRAMLAEIGKPVELQLERDGRKLTQDLGSFTQPAALTFLDGLAIGGDDSTTTVAVAPDSPAWRAGLRTNDRIVRIDGVAVSEWADIPPAVRNKADLDPPQPVKLSVMHQPAPGAALESREVSILPEASLLGSDLGLAFNFRQINYKADGPIAALKAGVSSTWRFLEDSWIFLQRVLSQDVSGKNAGGIITIGMVSTHWASEGLAKLFFFLCILSMNLAFLNVLPIPLLDGGHLFFLMIEKLKGSPVSAKIQVMSQAVGMVMLLSLMLYVTYNDIIRWFGS